MFSIPPLSHDLDASIQQRIDQKTKPRGALGELEALALHLVRLLGGERPVICSPTMLVFAGDHGVAAEGVSIASSDVTQQMVRNFLTGGASINVFCRQAEMALRVIDNGIIEAPEAHPLLVSHRLGAGTQAIHRDQAMTPETVEVGFANSRELINTLANGGCNLVGIGEMGIGNTTPASALMAALTGLPLSVCIGRGTGVSDAQLLRKKEIVRQALQLHAHRLRDPAQALAALGGFEIVGMTGAVLAAAERGMAVVIDGFISTVAALVACALEPHARDYLIFSHSSNERGHVALLDWLEATPILQLNLRMGEGAGAALALPLLRSAVAFYNEMATFEQAGVVV
ncbi:nicotinate-nucleotide--dimethylbenzimidazole phosphoribosyltransferase [Phytohalomonas tamaricis]|uniref:nicotinate-nucleotide--dimethylbenzimidazole phosphoribosyltransferase n=1 Tax=Phytohalomonas tamaricis TaxID=2081032 RepID=UPI000D0BB2F2|nr:nicotinate-nucleotide--dimethylbenzimidazole phosphoribosyltransferase [Phytohalomonas tamaricis]